MAATPKIEIKKSKLLIVEGKDEESFFDAAMTQHLNIADVQVLPIGGKQNLYINLKTLMIDPAFPSVTCLGIVRDADSLAPGAASAVAVNAASATFASLTGVLGSLALPQPPAHATFAPGPPKIGIFVMPDGVNDGMLETLCLNSANAQTGFSCIDGFFNCLVTAGVTLPSNIHKARVHAWLASRPEPGKRVGEAARATYWTWNDPAFTALWAFVGQM